MTTMVAAFPLEALHITAPVGSYVWANSERVGRFLPLQMLRGQAVVTFELLDAGRRMFQVGVVRANPPATDIEDAIRSAMPPEAREAFEAGLRGDPAPQPEPDLCPTCKRKLSEPNR